MSISFPIFLEPNSEIFIRVTYSQEVKNNKTGLVAKFPDTEDLKEKIKLILEDKKLKKRMAKNGKEFVKDFEVNKIIKKYEEIYEDAVNKK